MQRLVLFNPITTLYRSLPWPDIAAMGDQNDSRDLVWVLGGDRVEQRSGTCQAWSRSRVAYRRVPCDSRLPVFCQTDVKSECGQIIV